MTDINARQTPSFDRTALFFSIFFFTESAMKAPNGTYERRCEPILRHLYKCKHFLSSKDVMVSTDITYSLNNEVK